MPDAELLQALGFGAEMVLSIGVYVYFQERRPHFIMRLIACLAVLYVICQPYRVLLAGWLALFIIGIYLWTLVSIKLCFQLSWPDRGLRDPVYLLSGVFPCVRCVSVGAAGFSHPGRHHAGGLLHLFPDLWASTAQGATRNIQ